MPAGMLNHTQGYDDNRNYPEQHNNILPGQRITANTEIRQHFTQMRIQCDFEKLCEMYHLRRKELINHHTWQKLIEKACKSADQRHQKQWDHCRKTILYDIGKKHSDKGGCH